MKIFNQQQLAAWDQYTIREEGITTLQLVEEAGEILAEEIEIQFLQGKESPVRVFCGMGNNGADGLVVARILSNFIGDLEVFVLHHRPTGTKAFNSLLNALQSTQIRITSIQHIDDMPSLPDEDFVVVDAILGTGISRPIDGLLSEVISIVNSSPFAERIAIDIPSGVHPDKIMPGKAFKAHVTLSIASIKFSSFFSENEPYYGLTEVLPLQLSEAYVRKTQVDKYTMDIFDTALDQRYQSTFAHKYDFGHVLCIGGSQGMIGAALLASQAALRSGCGVVTAHVPACGVDIMQVGAPEVMLSIDDGKHYVQDLPKLTRFDVVCIGCGLGQIQSSLSTLKHVLEEDDVWKVIDADALNLLARNVDMLSQLNEKCILTPHAGEFDRLFGTSANSEARFHKTKAMAAKFGCYIILKGRNTLIATPNRESYFNMTGNYSLAIAGSGDVLAGYLAGCLAQWNDAFISTRRAVCLHGFAGEILRDQFGVRGGMARDLLQILGAIESHRAIYIDEILNRDEIDDDILGLELLDNPN